MQAVYGNLSLSTALAATAVLRTGASANHVGVVGVPFQPTTHVRTYHPDLQASAARVIECPSGQHSADALILVSLIHFGVDQDHQVLGQLVLHNADDFSIDVGLVVPLEQIVGDRQ